MLGSNIDETFLLAVVGKRPFFAIMLAADPAALVPIRPLEYRDSLEALKSAEDHNTLSPNLSPSYLIVIIEHAMVLGAIANVAELSYELGSIRYWPLHQDTHIFCSRGLSSDPLLIPGWHLVYFFEHAESIMPRVAILCVAVSLRSAR